MESLSLAMRFRALGRHGTPGLDCGGAAHCITVLVADVDAGGLILAREARAIRPTLGVVYTAMAPHRVAERERVPDAPILRAPYATHQLAGVISGLGRRILDDPLAAGGSMPPTRSS